MYLKIKSGVIISSKISTSKHVDIASSERVEFDSVLKEKRVMDIDTFRDLMEKASLPGLQDDARRVSGWLDLMLGKEPGSKLHEPGRV